MRTATLQTLGTSQSFEASLLEPSEIPAPSSHRARNGKLLAFCRTRRGEKPQLLGPGSGFPEGSTCLNAREMQVTSMSTPGNKTRPRLHADIDTNRQRHRHAQTRTERERERDRERNSGLAFDLSRAHGSNQEGDEAYVDRLTAPFS